MTRLMIALILLPFLFGCVMFNRMEVDLFKDHKAFSYVSGPKDKKDKIVIIPLHGMIVPYSSSFGSDKISPELVERMLAELREQKDIAAIIIDINSPGGAAAASEDILAQLNSFKRETNIKLFVYLSDIAASGGYYIAQSGDTIMANPNCITGSIGVISIFPQLQSFLKDKLSIEVVTIKTGKFKDSGTFLRNMTTEEKTYWQDLMMQYYDRFVNMVAQGRRLDKTQVIPLADGRVYHPNEALKHKLIDSVGTLPDAIVAAAKLAKVDNPLVMRLNIKSGGFSSLNLSGPQLEIPGLNFTATSSPANLSELLQKSPVWYLSL